MTTRASDEFDLAVRRFRFSALALQRTRADERILLSRRRTRTKAGVFTWLDALARDPRDVPSGATAMHDERTYDALRSDLLTMFDGDRSMVSALSRARRRTANVPHTLRLDQVVQECTDLWIDTLWRTRAEHPRTRGPVRRNARQTTMAILGALYLVYRAESDSSEELNAFVRASDFGVTDVQD